MSPRFLIPAGLASAALGFLLSGAFPAPRQPGPDAGEIASPPTPSASSPARAIPAPALEARLENGAEAGRSATDGFRQKQASNFWSLLFSDSAAERRLLVMEHINAATAEDLAESMAKEISGADFYRTTRFDFQFAAKRLAEIAPEKAAALWLKVRATHLGTDVLLAPWARRDPQGFASWNATLPPDAQKAVGQTMLKLAAEQPEQFLEMAPQLAKSPAGILGARGAVSGLIAKAQKGESPAAGLAFAQSLPEGPARSAALVELARWPGLDLAANPEIGAALARLSPSEARRFAQQLNPEALPPSPARESAYAGQIARAAQKDPQAAAKKVDALSTSPDYPAAVRGFVEATAAKDPAAAVDWALSITVAGPQRAAALEKAATEYYRLKPADARKWVEIAPLTVEEYQMLTGRSR
jgi:hypothetical protein